VAFSSLHILSQEFSNIFAKIWPQILQLTLPWLLKVFEDKNIADDNRYIFFYKSILISRNMRGISFYPITKQTNQWNYYTGCSNGIGGVTRWRGITTPLELFLMPLVQTLHVHVKSQARTHVPQKSKVQIAIILTKLWNSIKVLFVRVQPVHWSTCRKSGQASSP